MDMVYERERTLKKVVTKKTSVHPFFFFAGVSSLQKVAIGVGRRA
jgi:hypothetical protein